MNRLFACILAFFALLYAGMAADKDSATINKSSGLNIDFKPDGWHKYYYDGSYSRMLQEWNGTPFTMTAEFILPEDSSKYFIFPRCSWFGFWVDDTKLKERIMPVLLSKTDKLECPAELTFTQVNYLRGKGIGIDWSAKNIWKTIEHKIFLRLVFDGKTLSMQSSADGKQFSEQYNIPVSPDFKPDRIGLTLDSQCTNKEKAALVKGFRICNFMVEGSGPAVNDSFNGTKDIDWDFDGVNTRYDYPEVKQ